MYLYTALMHLISGGLSGLHCYFDEQTSQQANTIWRRLQNQIYILFESIYINLHHLRFGNINRTHHRGKCLSFTETRCTMKKCMVSASATRTFAQTVPHASKNPAPGLSGSHVKHIQTNGHVTRWRVFICHHMSSHKQISDRAYYYIRLYPSNTSSAVNFASRTTSCFSALYSVPRAPNSPINWPQYNNQAAWREMWSGYHWNQQNSSSQCCLLSIWKTCLL